MKKIAKYLPDFLIQLGALILAYSILPFCTHSLPGLRSLITGAIGEKTCVNYGGYERILGVMLITIGFNIFLRRYLMKTTRDKI